MNTYVRSAFALLAIALAAAANPLSLELQSVDSVAGGFRWTYAVNMVQGEDFTLKTPHDFVSITDFAGYVPNTADISLNWFEFSNPAISPVAHIGSVSMPDPLPAGADSPAIGNLVFEFLSNPSGHGPVHGPKSFTFSAVSIYGSGVPEFYLAQLTGAQGYLSQRGAVLSPAPVPEPSTLVFGLLGLAVLPIVRWRRSRA